MKSKIADEKGASTVELGMLLPVLMVLLAVTVPLIRAGWEYMVVSRAVSHGVRYASRADVNPRVSSPGALTRRPTTSEVQAFVADAATPLSPGAVAVTPEPSGALPGEPIHVSATYEMSFGPLASVANTLRGAFFGGQIFPTTTQVTVSSKGREE